MHINYLLFSTCFLLNIILTIYVRIHNLTATLKIRIDIDRIDSNSNFACIYVMFLCFYVLCFQGAYTFDNTFKGVLLHLKYI